MKKFLTIIAIATLSFSAHASIHLTTPYSVAGPTGTVTTGTAASATATSKTFDFQANLACMVYSFGTVTVSGGIDQTFTPLAGAPTVTLCLNLTSGAWTAGVTNGPLLQSGTITGTGLTNAQAVYTGANTPLRDAADYFASTTFLPGTQPDLWGAGDL